MNKRRRVGNSLPTNRFWPLLAIGVLLAIAIWGGLRANAAWHFLAAQSITNTMIDSGELTPAAIDEASRRIRLSLNRIPNQPDYLDLAGHLQGLKASQIGVIGKQGRELLESAAEYHRKALSIRPLWPYSWVNLLAVKDKLGQVDSEFNTSMKRAIETGPWEPRVQLGVITTGLHQWGRLGRTEKDLVREKVIHALRVQPREVFLIIRAFGRPDLVCENSRDFVQIKRWCDDVLTQVQS